MKEFFYLMSGNIDPSKDTDKIHYDLLKESNKETPFVLLFATASTGTDWHNNYISNISNIFSKYNCKFEIIEDDSDDLPSKIEKADIIYFLGGSPYKHTILTKYRELFRKVPIKAGTSAGAIYLGYQNFFAQKDDYIISVPNMLNFVDLHILPHSEMHTEDLVFNYLINEVFISTARLYYQSCIKIEKMDELEKTYIILGESDQKEKVEIILKNRKYFKIENDGIVGINLNLIVDSV